MKQTLFILLIFIFSIIQGQEHFCAKHKQTHYKSRVNPLGRSAQASPQISHEMAYDVKFVHLNLNIERINKYISGNVKTVATVTASVLDTFMTLLHKNYTIDSVYFNGTLHSSIRQDSMIKVGLPANLLNGATFTAQVYYKGTAPNGGGALGSGLSNAASWYGGGNRATWSVSESFVAYHWWPCKQSLTDKIDSSWVFITTDSTNKAGSNGLLKNIVTVGAKKRYEWKSKHPIDYYLISVAVSRFKEYNFYAKPQYLANDSIFIQNYIDASAWANVAWQANDKPFLDQTTPLMNFLSNMYGMYPYHDEKYGHCMVPLGGGMEHQTMTTIGYFDLYINAHELGHQWWGDNVTCKTWSDIWINEGFASYTEHLVAEYMDPPNFQVNLGVTHAQVMSQTGGSIHFTGNDTMNSARIFSSRLTYEKGGAIVHSLRFLTNNDSVWFNTLRGFQNTYKNGTASTIDFKNYYQAQTGINPTIFFNQWYYGEGYPIFNVRFHHDGNNCYIKSTQTTSKPSMTPLFITPLEYRITRTGKPDTTIRVMHNVSVENYTISLKGNVVGVNPDPKNWIINQASVQRDTTLGPPKPPVDPNPIAISETAADYQSVKIGPNPTKNIVTVTNPNHLGGVAKLFNLQGQLLEEKNLNEQTLFSLENYSTGVYFIRIVNSRKDEVLVQKVVRE